MDMGAGHYSVIHYHTMCIIMMIILFFKRAVIAVSPETSKRQQRDTDIRYYSDRYGESSANDMRLLKYVNKTRDE